MNPGERFSPELYQRVRSCMLRYLERRGCFWAEEVADEAIRRLWLKLQQTSPENVMGYAMTIVKLVYREWQRRERRFVALDEAPSPVETFDPALEETHRRLEEAIQSLAESDREFLRDYLDSDQAAAEIGERYGLGPAGVRSRVFRIRARLRIKLGAAQPNRLDETRGASAGTRE